MPYYLLYKFKVCIRFVRIKEFVGPHYGDQILRLGEIDDVVGVAGEHVDALDVVSTDFKLNNLIRAKLTLLNQTVSRNDDEKLPFGVVPVLTFGDAGLGDIDAHLAGVEGVN